MCPRRDWFITYEPLPHRLPVLIGDSHQLEAIGCGSVQIQLYTGHIMTMHDVYHIPALARNLLSVVQATTNDSSIEFFHDHCIIKPLLPSGDALNVRCAQSHRLYPLGLGVSKPASPASMASSAPIIAAASLQLAFAPSSSQERPSPSAPEAPSPLTSAQHTESVSFQKRPPLTPISPFMEWHYRLGHLNHQAISHMQAQKVALLPPFRIGRPPMCEPCVLGKHTKASLPRQASSRTKQILELIHSDVGGPFPFSLGGSKYHLLFINDFSRYTTVYFLKKKSEVFHYFGIYKALVENLHNGRTKTLRSDNGGEYISPVFLQFCNEHGIARQFTVPYTPEQNGVVVRKHRTLMDATRAMLATARLPKGF